MSEPLAGALDRVRTLLLDDTTLVRAVASGRRRSEQPPWRRVELRHVDLKTGRHLQVVRYDATQAHTANHAVGGPDALAVDELLALPFGNWTVETTTATLQLRVTKKGEAVVHTAARAGAPAEATRGHDRAKQRLLPEDHPVLRALGIADHTGKVKPSRQAKYRQVEEFLRLLDASLTEALAKQRLRRPTTDAPLRVVDLGCGNAYLTFAAHAWLRDVKGLPVRVTGVDVKQQSAVHNARVAAELGIEADFVVGTIADAVVEPAPEVVLALHACDTATDDALARALGWDAGLVLAAPCCHHDVATQLRRAPAPPGYAELLRHGILRERLADTLTDTLRAGLLRTHGYQVDVVEFVDSAHTPRNTLLRAVRSSGRAGAAAAEEYAALRAAWPVTPRLAVLLGEDDRTDGA